MTIKEIKVENFKNFDNLKIEFSNGVNLFVGSNGSGKTTILEAINVALGGFFGSQEQKMQRYIDFSEIRIVDKKRKPFAYVKAWSDTLEGDWTRNIKRDTKSNDVKGVKVASDYGRSIFEKFDRPEDRTVAPLIAFYSTQRLFRESSAKQKYDAANSRRNGYLQNLREESINGVLNEWFGNAVTRRATRFIQGINLDDQILENVEQAIRETLIFFLDLPKDFSLKIYTDPDFENELFVYYDEEHDLPLSYYSDGFRNLVYLIFDMVWRASQLNPWLNLLELGEQIKGVVTIDEIDLHLHPKWQAKAVSMIQQIFPNVQFFITTHSPTVVANLERGTLYEIRPGAVVRTSEDFFGKKVNDVLRDILGAPERHVPTQKKINSLFIAIDKRDEAKYIPLLKELKDMLGQDDPDMIKADTLIDWSQFKEE